MNNIMSCGRQGASFAKTPAISFLPLLMPCRWHVEPAAVTVFTLFTSIALWMDARATAGSKSSEAYTTGM
jgi:hypothetical protein